MEAVLVSKDFEAMELILKFSASRLFLSKEVSGFSVTNKSDELTVSEESTE